MREVDQRAELARRYLAEVSGTGVEQLPTSVLMGEVTELRRLLLAQVLGILAERQDEARQLAGIRAVLAAFDWEFDDPAARPRADRADRGR